ncbi:NTF2 fold immunity protein [Capnocytophaga sp.]|uniref:NTF2 fold immunity protein n=1 Tax=Capnocytophaga sp. TaxID=44737 RepID=UPI0026DD6F35|nr:NTF2 fold immunity protein [Capnocytophaga sp.]MDO5106299.1 NTF2 fold immunity protein [Capnocytophaga sp.]
MENQIISDTFIVFMRKMNAWEVAADTELGDNFELFDDADWQEKQTQIVREIFEEHLTQKERKYGMLSAGISVGFPPKYDPEKETITSIEVKGNSAVLTTQKNYAGIERERIYKLKKVNERWKIDTAKEKSKYDDKWHSVIF